MQNFSSSKSEGSELVDHVSDQSQQLGILEVRKSEKRKSNSVFSGSVPMHFFEQMDREFKCPICKCIFTENPKWLPCGHVFCNECLWAQINKEKGQNAGGDHKLPRCAECKKEYSHRNLKEQKWFNRMLELWRGLRNQNNLNTQIPQHFQLFDP
jgi:hypothetical protein